MITVHIRGGLGNQMFQYACGRALTLKNGDGLVVTRSNYSGDINRAFSLLAFDIKAEVTDATSIPFYLKISNRLRQKLTNDFYVNFQPEILTKRGNVYLDGYFQSEKYFTDFADVIREDFTLKGPLGEVADPIATQIQSCTNPVSLHVRRGDYLKESDFKDIANPEYYAKAINHILEKIADAQFFIFSDDIEWCKNNLSLPAESVFVSNPNMKDYEELVLMSRCQHHIIANSSFSWWGAWLGSNPAKVVIAPKRWSNNHENWYRDIIPTTWTRL